LKLHKSLKKRGLNSQNTESFVDLIELGVVKLPELQDQYQKLQDKVQGLQYNLQDMQYRKQELERYLKAIQQRINELTDGLNTLQQTFDLAAEKVSDLYKENTG
jgi:predicted nuclease with TOPRIM domain